MTAQPRPTPYLGWFEGAGLGIFVHWDHASQQGIELSWPLVGRSILPGQPRAESDVTPDQYHASATTFNPGRWDARATARRFKEAGAEYVVFTSRHHAGYSMFHTRYSKFSIEHSPYRGDLVRELVEAVRAEGMRVGLYYSLSNWHHPDYPAFTEADMPYAHAAYRRSSPEAWGRYLEYLRGQITELLTNYGPIDLLWFDGEWERTAAEWHADELRGLVASLQPNAIVNDRLPGQGDYITPEQGLPAVAPTGPWELCLTMNDSWAYRADDMNYKSARRIAEYLVEVTSRGGNLLLNVGPMGDGRLPETEVSLLRRLGRWIGTHGESVKGVKPANPRVEFYGPTSVRGSRLYLHLVMRPVETLVVRGIPVRRVERVTLLGTGETLDYQASFEVHEAGDRLSDDALGELAIRAPKPTSALIDVVAVDFAASLPPGLLDRRGA
jgi:alpha-L-fucosidase